MTQLRGQDCVLQTLFQQPSALRQRLQAKGDNLVQRVVGGDRYGLPAAAWTEDHERRHTALEDIS
jgi:hypothetical protein